MKKLLTLAALALATTTALTACGAESETTASAGDLEACQTEAAAAVEELRAAPEFELPDSDVDASAAEGKSVWVINLLSNELITAFTNGIQDAAEGMGMEFNKLDGSGTTQSSNQAITTALGAGADAIITSGIDPATVQNPLEKAEAAGVPVVTMIAGPLTDEDPLVFGDVTVDDVGMGEAYAAYALDQTDCDLTLGSIALPKAFDLNYSIDQVTTSEVERLCPSCSVESVYMDIANLATATPTQVQSMMKANPDVNYLALGFDAVAPYVGPAASAINPDIKMIGNNGLRANMQDIMDGGVQNADLTYPPNEYVGWLAVDKVLSAFSGGEGGNTAVPLRLVDESNIGDGNLETLFPSWDGYQDAFLDHWGK